MSDEELRALERRWHETGEVEDEARWHVARVRRGALTQARLDLAALLGVPGALAAVNRRRPPKPPGSAKGLRAWLGDLERHGEEVSRRAALAVGGLYLAEGLRQGKPSSDGSFTASAEDASLRAARACFDAAARWVLAPGDPRARARLEAVTSALRDRQLVWVLPAGGDLQAVVHVADALAQPDCPVARWFEAPNARRAVELHGAITTALGPWALGLRDPLAATLEVGLDAAEIAAPCPVAWEDMLPTADPAARHCTRCSLDVLDLTALPRAEAEARVVAAQRAGGLCVQLYRRPDGRLLTADCVDALVASLPEPQQFMTRGMLLPIREPEAT